MTLLLVSAQEQKLTLNLPQREALAHRLRKHLIPPGIEVTRWGELVAGCSEFITHDECRILVDHHGDALLTELVELGW